LVKLLLDNGADINVKNKFGRNAIEYALSGEDNEVIDLIMSHGAPDLQK